MAIANTQYPQLPSLRLEVKAGTNGECSTLYKGIPSETPFCFSCVTRCRRLISYILKSLSPCYSRPYLSPEIGNYL